MMKCFNPLTLILLSICIVTTVSSGCASHAKEDRIPGHEVVEKAYGPDQSIINEAVAFLSRKTLKIEYDRLEPGVYTPSQIFGRADFWCSHILLGFLSDIEAGNTDKYLWDTGSRLIKKAPKERSPFEKLDNQRWNMHQMILNQKRTMPPQFTQFDCFTDNSRDGFRNPNSFGSENTWDTDSQDDCVTEKEHDKLAMSMNLAGLEYVVIVTNSEKQHYCNNLSNPVDTNWPAENAEAEHEKLKERVADLTYSFSEKELQDLAFLLPSKYRGYKDYQLALPPRLQAHFSDFTDQFMKSIIASFRRTTIEPREITFDRRDLAIMYEDPWFNAAVPEKGEMYFSPLLARAPYLLCYNQGANDYVRGRFRLFSLIEAEGYRPFTDSDIRSVAGYHKEYSESYQKCVESQLFFLVAHEMGHILAQNDDSSNSSEEVADCFAYVTTIRDTAYDMGFFREMLFRDNPDFSEAARKSIHYRKRQLSDLDQWFAQEEMPNSGEETVEFCRYFDDKSRQRYGFDQ